jgi:hypothetical protein
MVFFGRLLVHTRRCDLVVPADGGWGRGNKLKTTNVSTYECSETRAGHLGVLKKNC